MYEALLSSIVVAVGLGLLSSAYKWYRERRGHDQDDSGGEE